VQTTTECQYLSPQRIAATYGFTSYAVLRWINDGITVGGHQVRLAAEKIGKSWRVRTEDWEEFRRLCNPATWREIAERQQGERKEAGAAARREEQELAADLGRKGKGRRKG
jgi:hypothetical protein